MKMETHALCVWSCFMAGYIHNVKWTDKIDSIKTLDRYRKVLEGDNILLWIITVQIDLMAQTRKSVPTWFKGLNITQATRTKL